MIPKCKVSQSYPDVVSEKCWHLVNAVGKIASVKLPSDLQTTGDWVRQYALVDGYINQNVTVGEGHCNAADNERI